MMDFNSIRKYIKKLLLSWFNNKPVLNKFSETDGNLFYDNIQITSNDAVSDEEKSTINSIIDNIK